MGGKRIAAPFCAMVRNDGGDFWQERFCGTKEDAVPYGFVEIIIPPQGRPTFPSKFSLDKLP